MKRAQDKFAGDGFVVIGFNSDTEAKKMNDYIAEQGYSWSHWFMGDKTKELQNRYWVGGYPTNLLVGRDGRIVTRSIRLGDSKSEAVIRRALGQDVTRGK